MFRLSEFNTAQENNEEINYAFNKALRFYTDIGLISTQESESFYSVLQHEEILPRWPEILLHLIQEREPAILEFFLRARRVCNTNLYHVYFAKAKSILRAIDKNRKITEPTVNTELRDRIITKLASLTE